MAVNLTTYDIIQGPVLTDKAYHQYKKLNTLMLRVHPDANKPQIKAALERLFNVKVAEVRVVMRKGKNKVIRALRKSTQSADRKHAYITLKPGYSLDLMGQGSYAAADVSSETPTETAKE